MFLAGLLFLPACLPATKAADPVPPRLATAGAIIPTQPPAERSDIPPHINALTGQSVADPSLLNVPALLISISHFPATGRPQAGLSFAPFVYEVSITEGATRFLPVFYGEFPAPEFARTGTCAVRTGTFKAAGLILGNRVWLDANANGLQDAGERGVGGVCINLYDMHGSLLQQTSTDSNGYYGFSVQSGPNLVEFVRPDWARFTAQDAGEESLDSDPDPVTGRADALTSTSSRALDAGLFPEAGLTADPALMPLAQVGPIRSGRLVYGYIADSFQNSCLIFAGASGEVLERLPVCHLVFHQLAGGGYMLDISQMLAFAADNQRAKGSKFDYNSNIYSDQPPSAGVPAASLQVYIAYLNQSAWLYDPLYQAYLRYVDTSEMEAAGMLHADTDRLTGRQLHFENVIVLFSEHDVISPTNLDIRLDPGRSGEAMLFRDGYMYPIRWNTFGAEEDPVRPMAFVDLDNNPIPLRPGHTWVLVVTPESSLQEQSAGNWQLIFLPPEGAD